MNNTPLTDSLFPSHIEPVNLEVGQLLIKARNLCSELEQQSKSLSHYSSQELFNELKRRNENIELLEINSLDYNGITIKDIVVKYGNDGEYDLYAAHIRRPDGFLEFIYNDYELERKIMPSCFCEREEGIFESKETLEKCLEILKKCGIECEKDDSFFDF